MGQDNFNKPCGDCSCIRGVKGPDGEWWDMKGNVLHQPGSEISFKPEGEETNQPWHFVQDKANNCWTLQWLGIDNKCGKLLAPDGTILFEAPRPKMIVNGVGVNGVHENIQNGIKVEEENGCFTIGVCLGENSGMEYDEDGCLIVTCCDGGTFTPNPSITLTKIASLDAITSASVGDVVNYSFLVVNTGNVNLSNISIADPDVSVAGSLPFLPVGGVDSTSFTATYTLTQADLNAGVKNNTATVSGSYQAQVVTDSSSASCLLDLIPDLDIVKEVDHTNISNPTEVGDVIGYNFIVTNAGPVDIDNVVVTDQFAVVSGAPIPVLPAGTTNATNFTGSHIVTQADIDAGVYNNLAVATGQYNGAQIVAFDEASCVLHQTDAPCLPIVDLPDDYTPPADTLCLPIEDLPDEYTPSGSTLCLPTVSLSSPYSPVG